MQGLGEVLRATVYSTERVRIEEICKTGSMLGNPVFTAVCTLLKHHRLLM